MVNLVDKSLRFVLMEGFRWRRSTILQLGLFILLLSSKNILFMSLLLNQPSELCFRKPLLVRSSPLVVSNGVSSSLPQKPPSVRKFVIRRAVDITPLEKKMPLQEMKTIGSSNGSGADASDKVDKIIWFPPWNGWLATLKDGIVCLQDTFASKSILLPPLVTLPHCQTQIVTNMAMSSSYLEDEDCVVAVKFLGPQLSFCRPAQSNSEWINIRISSPCFFSSHVMFSKRDDMFQVLGSGGHLIESWDLRTQVHTRKFQKFRLRGIPNLTKVKKQLLDSCCKSQHLAESTTTGETFLVKLYKNTTKIINGIARMKTEALMVFRLDKEGNAFYTQGIGDLCIFLTKSENVCLPFSSFPGVYPNHVVISHDDETAIINLADKKWNC